MRASQDCARLSPRGFVSVATLSDPVARPEVGSGEAGAEPALPRSQHGRRTSREVLTIG
jgi:hypothetical protein